MFQAGYLRGIFIAFSPPQRIFCGKSHFPNFLETLGHTNFCGRPDVRDFFQSLAGNIFVLDALFHFFSKALPYFTILTQIRHFHLIKIQQGIHAHLLQQLLPLQNMMAIVIFASKFVHYIYDFGIETVI